jgi:hypothetical protein
MIKCCAWGIVAMACFTLNGAIGQAPFDIQLQAAAKTPVARLTPQGGNPMWGEFPSAHFPPRVSGRSFPRPGAHLPRYWLLCRLPKPRRPSRQNPSNLLSHWSEPRSASHKMSRSLSNKRRKISFVCMSVKRPQAGICVRSSCGP